MADQSSVARGTLWTPAVRDFAGALLLLILALSLALASTFLRHAGRSAAAIAIAVLALTTAGFVAAWFVPRLLRRVNVEYWGSIRLFRVTARGGLFLFLLLLIAMATLNSGNNLLVLILSFLLAALLVSGMVSNLVLHGLRVSLTLPDTIHAGQRAVAFLTLHNQKRRVPSFALGLKGRGDCSPEVSDFFTTEKHFPYLSAGTSLTARLESSFKRRGVLIIKGFEVRTKFPFGFFYRGRDVEAEGKITIYPALIDPRPLIRRYPFLQGPEVMNRRGFGSGLYNIRDYQLGDDSRYIHWKSTAKLSRLMVKEFIEERDEMLQLVFSSYLGKGDPASLAGFERALSCIASLARYYADRGLSFSFYSGEFETVVNGNREGVDPLMDYLSWVQPAERLLIDPHRVGRGSVVFAAGRGLHFEGVPVVDYLAL